MALKPEFSIMGGLAVGAIVFAIHSQATPTQADIQALPPGLPDIDSAERKATIMSAGVVAGVSLIAKDPGIFLIGSAMTIALALWTRHSNHTTGMGGGVMSGSAQMAGSANTGPAVAETEPYHMFENEFAR